MALFWILSLPWHRSSNSVCSFFYQLCFLTSSTVSSTSVTAAASWTQTVALSAPYFSTCSVLRLFVHLNISFNFLWMSPGQIMFEHFEDADFSHGYQSYDKSSQSLCSHWGVSITVTCSSISNITLLVYRLQSNFSVLSTDISQFTLILSLSPCAPYHSSSFYCSSSSFKVSAVLWGGRRCLIRWLTVNMSLCAAPSLNQNGLYTVIDAAIVNKSTNVGAGDWFIRTKFLEKHRLAVLYSVKRLDRHKY